MKVWFKNSTFKYDNHPDYLWKWPFLDIFVFEFVDCENKVVTGEVKTDNPDLKTTWFVVDNLLALKKSHMAILWFLA